MTTAVRVLVVDDHTAVRQGIRAMLDEQSGIVCVGAAASAGAAHELWLAEERPPADVVLVDRHLPDEDGLSLCLWLTTREPAPAVVIYSAFADDSLSLPAVVAGAAGVVSKAADPDALCAVVRAVAAGERRLPGPDAVPAQYGGRLAPNDLPILGMLRHGVPSRDVAATLGIDAAALVARRWAMLEALTAPPERREEPRVVRRSRALRPLAEAAGSPGWS